MLSTLMCIRTTYTDVVLYYIKVIQMQAWDSVECRNLRKFILKVHSELNVFNLGGNVFQVEDPEKAKLVLNWSIRGQGAVKQLFDPYRAGAR